MIVAVIISIDYVGCQKFDNVEKNGLYAPYVNDEVDSVIDMDRKFISNNSFASRMRTSSVLGLILFHIDSGRTFFQIKVGPDQVSRIVSNFLVDLLEN